MLKEISTLLEVARNALPKEWIPSKWHEMTDAEGNVIISCASARHAEYIAFLSPSKLIRLLERVQEALSNRHRYVIAVNELHSLRFYFQGISFTEDDGMSVMTTTKITEAISFHDRQSAERMLEGVDKTIAGIKTTILKVGRDER